MLIEYDYYLILDESSIPLPFTIITIKLDASRCIDAILNSKPRISFYKFYDQIFYLLPIETIILCLI